MKKSYTVKIINNTLVLYRRSSSSSDSIITTRSASHTLSSSASLTRPSLNKKSSSSGGLAQVQLPRYLWIRLALFEKVLAKIIDHLVQNSRYVSFIRSPDRQISLRYFDFHE